MEIKMVNNRILVECQDEGNQQSASGIYLAVDTSQEQVKQGTVVSVGPGRPVDLKVDSVDLMVGSEADYYPGNTFGVMYNEMPVKAGDQILYPNGGGLKYRKDGKDYIILTDYEVLAIL